MKQKRTLIHYGTMRYISIQYVVVVAVTFYCLSISAFTSYPIRTECRKPSGMKNDQRGHSFFTSSGTIERPYVKQQKSSSQLCESNKKKGGLDESVRTKLVSESIAPWRTLRLFFYFSLGSGALVGGLITLTGFAAVVSGAKEGDVNTELLNLGIDFGAVAVFALLAKFDIQKGIELNEMVEERMGKKKEQKKILKGMRDRELELGNLRLAIQISPDGTTRDAAVQELQAGARQHIIIVAGPKKACRDALVGANLLKMDFAMNNVLVVPYEIVSSDIEKQTRPEGSGFADRPIYEKQAYVARATGEGWEEYINAEINDAVELNGEKVRDEGIALVVASNGKVIRRGVGKVPWRQMVEQLDETVGGGRKKDAPWIG